MEKKQIPNHLRASISSYLSERTIQVDEEEITIECGVPQGSVLGPTLWNIYYDEVLQK